MRANNRSTKTKLLAGTLPVIDDRTLVTRILTLPLGATLRAELEELLPRIEPGKFGQLKKSLRDKLYRLAVDGNLLARVTPSKGIHVSVNNATYESRVVEGTAFAEELIARFVPSKGGSMPVPPGRRVA